MLAFGASARRKLAVGVSHSNERVRCPREDSGWSGLGWGTGRHPSADQCDRQGAVERQAGESFVRVGVDGVGPVQSPTRTAGRDLR